MKKHPLVKKLEKLEREYEKAPENATIKRARILRRATNLETELKKRGLI